MLLALVTAVAVQNQTNSASPASWARFLDRSVWIDIGLGRKLNALTPKQVVELRKCQEPTMAFQQSGGTWVQSFYAGIEMRTTYSSATTKFDPAGSTVLFYMAGHSEPAETLHVAQSGDVLVEQTRGFRAHAFLKCVERKEAPSKARPRQ
ncbi:MAG TPA: hypothetical protein VHW69_16320 [Rhizomicrobium sp.]|nr:hypothetical protein [Rhizomicrobium sp.]